jgi:hypothetical protein
MLSNIERRTKLAIVIKFRPPFSVLLFELLSLTLKLKLDNSNSFFKIVNITYIAVLVRLILSQCVEIFHE